MLTSDGTIVIPFYDHGDGEENASIIWSDDNGETWKSSNDVPGAGGDNRSAGKIFTFLVEEDKSLTLKNTYSVQHSSVYQYSCMSQLKNGTIGLLWENSWGGMRYDNYDIAKLAADGYVNDLELGVALKKYTLPMQVMQVHFSVQQQQTICW